MCQGAGKGGRIASFFLISNNLWIQSPHRVWAWVGNSATGWKLMRKCPFGTVRVTGHWNDLPRNVVHFPSLKVFQWTKKAFQNTVLFLNHKLLCWMQELLASSFGWMTQEVRQDPQNSHFLLKNGWPPHSLADGPGQKVRWLINRWRSARITVCEWAERKGISSFVGLTTNSENKIWSFSVTAHEIQISHASMNRPICDSSYSEAC